MAHLIQTPFQRQYIEIKTAKAKVTNNNIICCVDISPSMDGEPLKNVSTILRDIYRRTQIKYPLFCYDSVVTKTSIEFVEKADLTVTGGGTSFSAIFDAMREHLMKDMRPTTFIFMTDGENNCNAGALQRSIEMLKLTLSAMKQIPITIHVIGFGNVKNDFLDGVRRYGTKEGLFKYSTQSAELQNDFNDMFEYATSAKEYVLRVGNATYTANSNDDTVGFLTGPVDDVKQVTVTSEGETMTLPLTPLPARDTRSIHLVRALNLVSPDCEESVREVLKHLNGVVPSGNDVMERLEVEQIKREVTTRMMEYIQLFTQIKMGQVPEQVKLKLSALRHEATFSNLARKRKLDLRVSKNVEYFKKTDITGILEGFRKGIDQATWDDIRALKDEWVCTYSKEDLNDVMRRSPDNVLCIGILVERDESAVEDSVRGLKLVSVSNTIISYDSFIRAITLAKAQQDAGAGAGAGAGYGEFSGINDTYCVVGSLQEKINAVVPLYIHPEHMKRVRILEGQWLGYLYTLDSFAYDRSQEVGLVKLLHDMMTKDTGTTRYRQVVTEVEKVCQFIVTESLGFKQIYPDALYERYIAGNRGTAIDPVVHLMVGYLRGDVKRMAGAVYYDHIRRKFLAQKGLPEGQRTVERLLYGNDVKTVSVADSVVARPTGRDYVEESFERYFDNERVAPAQLIPETYVGATRKALAPTDETHLKGIVPPVPDVVVDVFGYSGLPLSALTDQVHYDDVRAEILMALHFGDSVPDHVTRLTIVDLIDEQLQGSFHNMTQYDWTPENVELVAQKALQFRSVRAFAGLMRKYCVRRCGPVFDAVVKGLLAESAGVARREKLIALMTNMVGYTPFYKGHGLGDTIWQPHAGVDVEVLRSVVGPEFDEIEKQNLTKPVVHCYRLHKPNRQGNSNSHPNMNRLFPFLGYRQRQ